jgi:hypothetical protein
MPTAELATDLTVNGAVIVPKGTELTAIEARELCRTYQQLMEFRCFSCQLPLVLANVRVNQEPWKQGPYFRSYPDQKGKHRDPCPFAGEGEQDGAFTGESDVVPDKTEIPTKLVKRTRNSSGALTVASEPCSPVPEGDRMLRHEEHTSAVVKDFCNVYLDKIKDYPDPKDHGIALQGLRLFLPDSDKNIGYVRAFQHVSRRFLPSSYRFYRIFYGPVKEAVRCRDGYVVSYKIPGRYNDAWKPVIAYLPRDILDEFGRSPAIEHMLVHNEINTRPWAFLCGRPRPEGEGIVIPLESGYWFHCAKHSCWLNQQYVQVSEVSQSCREVIQRLIAKRLDEFHQKFLSADSRSINNSEALPQQEPSIYRADLSSLPASTASVTPPVTQQDSPEQSSTHLNTPISLSSLEQESAHTEKRQSWLETVISSIRWLWEKL